VAAILGQSLAVLLETYAHYIQDDQESASKLMDSITTPMTVNLPRTNESITHGSRTKTKKYKIN